MRYTERWEDVPGYEGLYQVSDYGRVRSIVNRGHRIAGLMSPVKHGERYLYISLTKDGRKKNHYIHRLVASAFLENPKGLPVVNHIDYDTNNNTVSNLEWCTQRDNTIHSSRNMRKPKSVTHTNTGEKYITYRAKHKKYRLIVKKKEYQFQTIEEAIKKRMELIGE